MAVDAHLNVIQPEFLYSKKKVEANVSVNGETATGEVDIKAEGPGHGPAPPLKLRTARGMPS